MNKTLLIFLTLILFQSACKKDEDMAILSNTKPNILLIIADDVGIEATPGYPIGAIKPSMPNLQNLAASGITFTNVWSNPVCSPTRASILTGRYGYRTGVLDAEDNSTISSTEKTLQTFLDENASNAYSHAIIGKWHLSPMEPMRPTQMGIGYYAGLIGGAVNDYNVWPLTENAETNLYNGYITTKLTDLAINWINLQDKPWFCWLAYTAPHTPFHLPPDEMHSQGSLPTDSASVNSNPMPYFMAMTESIDYEMNRIMENIPADELANTIIIFIGDNGTHPDVTQSPYDADHAKGSLYQGGINVPMIISGKGVTRFNETDDNLISSTDLFATIAEIAGINLPVYEDSHSFEPLLNDAGTGTREFNYSEVYSGLPNKSGYTIRNYQYKLIEFDSGQMRFYDLLADPYESNNLLSGTLTTDQETAHELLMTEASFIRN